MKTITTADLRKDASNWNGGFIVNKMKQGRDKLTDKTFVVMEVPVNTGGEEAIDYAIAYLNQKKEAMKYE
jgi:hypothetical protein